MLRREEAFPGYEATDAVSTLPQPQPAQRHRAMGGSKRDSRGLRAAAPLRRAGDAFVLSISYYMSRAFHVYDTNSKLLYFILYALE